MAGRIPDSFIQDLLARTDIVQVIGERLQLKKAGKEYVALSPFSNEKSPSFTVSPQKQFYHCFSSGKHGTAITFLMEYDRLSFPEAVEELARKHGMAVPREGGSAPERLVLDGPLDALAAAERIYKAELKKSPEAIEYLKQRGLSGETAKRFGIGFAPDRWDTIAGQVAEKHALEAGLLVKNDQGRIYDFYRRRIMFPVRNLRGQIITFGGRVLPGSDDNRKYLNGRETPLFDKGRQLYGLYEARQGTGAIPYILVVEGYMDVVMLAQHGIRHAVATMGTATTREHLNLLFKSTQRVVFCFDGDRAGRAAAWRALEQALPEANEGRELLFMFLPDNAQGGKHDPDSFVRELGAEEFNRRVGQAQSLSGYLLAELSGQVNLGTADGRARLVALARPHLARLREGPLRTLILDELSRRTKLNRADIESARQPVVAGPDVPAAAATTSKAVGRALRALLEDPALALEVTDADLLMDADSQGIGALLDALSFFTENPKASAGQLIEGRRGSPHEHALTTAAGQAYDPRIESRNEFQSALADLRLSALQGRHDRLLGLAHQRDLSAGENRDLLELKRLLGEQRALARQLAGAKPV